MKLICIEAQKAPSLVKGCAYESTEWQPNSHTRIRVTGVGIPRDVHFAASRFVPACDGKHDDSESNKENIKPGDKVVYVCTCGGVSLGLGVAGVAYHVRELYDCGVYLDNKTSWVLFSRVRLVARAAQPAAEPIKQTKTVSVPPPTKPAAPTFICRCCICDKKLEQVVGLMAIAYPFTPGVISRPNAAGFDAELRVACTDCSRDVAAYIAHKKKPMLDAEDLL